MPVPGALCGSIRLNLQLLQDDRASPAVARRLAVSPCTEEIPGGAVREKQPGNKV